MLTHRELSIIIAFAEGAKLARQQYECAFVTEHGHALLSAAMLPNAWPQDDARDVFAELAAEGA